MELPRDAKFVGRDEFLRKLNYNSVIILHGPSGTGKTHVAIEHAYRNRDQRPDELFMWLSSRGFWRLEQSIGTLLRDLGIHRANVDGLRQFIAWYNSQNSDAKRHLVFDDLSFDCFPEMEKVALVNFLNTFKPLLGRVLITTRLELSVLLENGIDTGKMRLIEMDSFSNDEAKKFLDTRLSEGRLKGHETNQTLKSLQYSPVGLALFAAFGSQYMRMNDEEDAWHQLKKQVSSEASNTLELTLKAAVDYVARSNDKSYEMLCCMSALDTQGMPLPLLYIAWAEESPHYTLEVRRGLRRLLSLSLIGCSRDGYQCFMNELIRTYLYKRLSEDGTLASYHWDAVKDLDALFGKVHRSMLLQTCEALIPHIRQALRQAIPQTIIYEATDCRFPLLFTTDGRVTNLSKEDWMRLQKSREALLCKLGIYRERMSKLPEAHKYFCDAETICEQVYGTTDMRTMEVAEHVAYTEMMMDKPDEAAVIHEIIESIYTTTLEPDDWRLLIHSGAYGAVLMEQGKWQAAEVRLLQGAQGAIKLYGKNNKSGIIARNSLVRLYGLTGKWEKGRAQAEENLRLFLRDMPKTHPNVIQAMTNLGNMLAPLGRYKEAIEQHREAVKYAKLSSDVTSQGLFDARKELSVALSTAGEIVAAAEQQEELITLLPYIEPEPGLTTLNAHLNLGITLDRLSRYDKAQRHLEEAFELCKTAPRANPTLLRVRNSLALLYLRQGDSGKAETQYRDLLQVQMERHADNLAHPDVILIQNNLGGALQQQRKYAEAIQIQHDVLEKALSQPDFSVSRQVMFGRNNLAESLRLWAEDGGPNGVAMLEEAKSLHDKALEQREQQLGEVWQTWVSRVNIGMVLQAQGRPEEARGWYVDLDKLIKAVGEGNVTVIRVKEKQEELDKLATIRDHNMS
ncbi:TPR-like protein [Rhizodiscina lignyota]|uniref:TPR-like protein n=1 Tax=Rhizodiscina lignyota TaxID=1504668 RepID=A0A9P4I3K8_9PEZI|nr:TPR-like protein [Rhizodiscina lignyota]